MGLNSLKKKGVFGHMIKTPYDVKTSGYKWVLCGIKIVRYKADVAQGFSQRPVMRRHTPMWWMQLLLDFS